MDTTGVVEWTPHTAAFFLNSHPAKCPVDGAGLWQPHEGWRIKFWRIADRADTMRSERLCASCFWWAQEHLPMRKVG